MTRQLITALIVAVTSTIAVGNVEADCHSHVCQPTYGFAGFHARFGCSPREAFVLFQRHPELITRFPQTARLLQTEFGALATPVTGPVTATETVVGTGNAAAINTPIADAPANVAPATEVVTDAAAIPTPAEGPALAAPNAADTIADPNAPPADLPVAAPIRPELEPLLGLWVNESDAAGQPIAKINLANDGNATLTVNTAVGQADVKKPFAIEDDTFKFDGDDLAKVVSADADKVVLDANGTALTFVRP
jgi:hypothetical protein